MTSSPRSRLGSNSSDEGSGQKLLATPVYLFFNSLKVTHRRSDDQNINFKEDAVVGTGVEYAHLSHSHDIVDLKMIDHLITEEGEITMESIGG